MSGARDEFVRNAASHESRQYIEDEQLQHTQSGVQGSSRARPYSPLHNYSYSSHPDNPFSSSRDPKYPMSFSEHHELSDYPTDPFFPQSANQHQRGALEDPFIDQQEAPRLANKSHTKPHFPHIEERLKKRFYRNERNRRKLENSLPKNHYTKLPWFTIIASTAQLIVFIVELARMGILTGSPFQTKPYFNPMLGPSTYILINMGARYVPCMHEVTDLTLDISILYPCPNSTSVATNVCTLNELCGINGIPIIDNKYIPDQYYRMILPIFLHAGILHIFFNLVLQLTMGVSVERAIGWIKYGIIYMASGIAGFLLGANFSPNGIASTGASGSLFGIMAANLLLFVYCGKKNTNIYATTHYKTFILIMVAEIVVSFVLGLLPGLDNFSHIGGFCMGFLLSVVFLKDPSFVFRDGIYTFKSEASTWQLFLDNWNPLNGREDKIFWKFLVWIWFRIVCLVLAILYFVLLTRNLYSTDQQSSSTCSWCKYINCIPVHDWCEIGDVSISTTGSQPTAAASSV